MESPSSSSFFASTQKRITSSPFLSRPTPSASTPTMRSITPVRRFTPSAEALRRKIWARRAAHHVHDVVQVGGQLMGVLAIERCDERAVEAVQRLVRHLVGFLLQP